MRRELMTDINKLWHHLLHVSRRGAVTDWWCSWPMTNMLAYLCSCQWRTFWTYLVTIDLFSLYFIAHLMQQAIFQECIIKVWKMMIHLHKLSMFFKWDWHVFHVCAKIFFLLTAVQKLFFKRIFPSHDHKCTATFFMKLIVHMHIDWRVLKSQDKSNVVTKMSQNSKSQMYCIHWVGSSYLLPDNK